MGWMCYNGVLAQSDGLRHAGKLYFKRKAKIKIRVIKIYYKTLF